MACSDYGRQTTNEEIRAYRGYSFSDLEDALCSACTALEKAGLAIPAGAAVAWAAHKKNDAKRISIENAEAERLALKETGLNKLTAKERDALGLR